ncbi:FREE1-like protein [Drosera capensis]
MHQGGDPYYQFYQSQSSQLQNPNPHPNPNPDTQFPSAVATPWPPTTLASAPPAAPYTASSDYPSYQYPQSNQPPSAPSYINQQGATGFKFQYGEPNQGSYYPYAQNPSALNHTQLDHSSNPGALSHSANPGALNHAQLDHSSIPGVLGHAQLDHGLNHGTNLSYSAGSGAYPAGYGYDNPVDYGKQYEHWSGYLDGNGASKYEEPRRYGSESYDGGNQGFSDAGVYRYDGGGVEPYGARGTAGSRSSSSSQVMFDDYGRPVGVSGGKGESARPVGSMKVVKAVPKNEVEEDVRNGVQKFRVKVLAEGAGQSDMDVLCQIGLDGIRMVEPATGRTQRIYPLEAVTRWEVLESHIFAFWAKTSVDVEPKRIRLKSNSYTTNTILDAVTAASVQLKEMGDEKSLTSVKPSDLANEKKKGFPDFLNLIKPPVEEKDHWVPDEAVTKCIACGSNFGPFNRRHHCRNCGDIFCDKCTQGRTPLSLDDQAQPVRVCDRCMAEVTQRLANAREATSRIGGSLRSHEDLAKKLKEEMNKNLKGSSGGNADGSKARMREVACPTCTVHLQVQVPSSGSETIECSVCQHPFLVSAH